MTLSRRINRKARRAVPQKPHPAPAAPRLELDRDQVLLDACAGVLPGPMVADGPGPAILAVHHAIMRSRIETGGPPDRLFVSLARADQLRREVRDMCVREAAEATLDRSALCVIDGVPVYLQPVTDGREALELLKRVYPDRVENRVEVHPRSPLLDLVPR